MENGKSILGCLCRFFCDKRSFAIFSIQSCERLLLYAHLHFSRHNTRPPPTRKFLSEFFAFPHSTTCWTFSSISLTKIFSIRFSLVFFCFKFPFRAAEHHHIPCRREECRNSSQKYLYAMRKDNRIMIANECGEETRNWILMGFSNVEFKKSDDM